MAKYSFWLLVPAIALLAGTASAQSPRVDITRPDAAAAPSLSDGSPTITESMWYYLQEQQRHDDPRQAVRRNAEFRGDQRRRRLASQAWFGYSPSRPQASPVPFMGTAAPAWSGNSYDPYRWIGWGSSGGVFVHPLAVYR